MSFTLENVVPWGRSYDEYIRIFDLTDRDLSKYILGCGDGPAAFNSHLTGLGGRIISADPLYQFSADAIRKRIDETCDEVIVQTEKNIHEFTWQHIKSVRELKNIRMSAMNEFLDNFSENKSRYIPAELPSHTGSINSGFATGCRAFCRPMVTSIFIY